MSILSPTRKPKVNQGVSIQFGTPPGPLVSLFKRFYEMAPSQPSFWSSFPTCAEPLIEHVMQGEPFQIGWNMTMQPLPVGAARKKEVLVSFTGGKDSVAACLQLESQGLKPHAFFVRNLNRSYPGELTQAKAICEKMSWPLHVEAVKQAGTRIMVEVPVKNQLILAMAIEYGAPLGIVHYAQGNHTKDHLADLTYRYNGTDCIETYQASQPIFEAYLPGFTLHVPLLSDTDAYKVIARLRPDLYPLLASCFMPCRYKHTTRRANERKFGPLMPYRCGSCFKCALEHLARVCLGMEPNTPARVNHSVACLIKGWASNYSSPIPHSPREVVHHYLFPDELDSSCLDLK